MINVTAMAITEFYSVSSLDRVSLELMRRRHLYALQHVSRIVTTFETINYQSRRFPSNLLGLFSIGSKRSETVQGRSRTVPFLSSMFDNVYDHLLQSYSLLMKT
jgi:hypothetical protein